MKIKALMAHKYLIYKKNINIFSFLLYNRKFLLIPDSLPSLFLSYLYIISYMYKYHMFNNIFCACYEDGFPC